MEKWISDEERIRRAEDVVERRNANLGISAEDFNKEKSYKKVNTMFCQAIVCLIIYFCFYCVKNSTNNSSKVFINNVNSILKNDTDFKKIYCNIKEKFQKTKDQVDTNNSNGENTYNNQNDENKDDTEEKQSEIENELMGIGGELQDTQSQESDISAELNTNEMDIDAKYIKDKMSIINPLESGVITSRFGTRNSSLIVSANHKGIDIGAKTGSEIISATDGVVIEASSAGDFGKHLKIQNHDIIFIYGHCNKLFVNEGDHINIGQKIAEVGSTGNATGPHLHFEIRRNGRSINPELVLNFE